jgi:prolyl-tRNA editing enzyme YbaK/EbsC (Cys-tRNA(Pro) deacylase)
VDWKKLAVHFQVSRKKVRMADAETVIALTGYAPGTVPPFGHREKLIPLIDPAVLKQEIVYAGGGGITAMLRIRSSDLQQLTSAAIVDVLENSTAP